MPTNHDREVRLARAAYVGAVHQLAEAMQRWDTAGVPLLPEGSGDVPAWSDEHIRLTVEAARAWQNLVAQRRAYEETTRSWQPRS